MERITKNIENKEGTLIINKTIRNTSLENVIKEIKNPIGEFELVNIVNISEEILKLQEELGYAHKISLNINDENSRERALSIRKSLTNTKENLEKILEFLS